MLFCPTFHAKSQEFFFCRSIFDQVSSISDTLNQFLGLVLPHLPREIFRADFSPCLSIFPRISWTISVSFHQILVKFSQSQSNLFKFESALSKSYKAKTHQFLADRKVGQITPNSSSQFDSTKNAGIFGVSCCDLCP